MTIEELINVGETAIKDGKYQEAVDAFEEAYQQEQTVELNVRLVSSLELAQQYEQAYRIATELPWSAYDTIEMQDMFIDVALHVDRPIAARKMLAQYSGDVSAALNIITSYEKKMAVDEAQQIKSLTREFYHLGENSLVQQQQSLSSMEQLPLKEYLFGAKGVLIDPFANALIRATVFESLRHLGINEPVEMVAVTGDTYQIVPSTFTKIDMNNTYKDVVQELREQEQIMDPVIWQVLYQQANLMMQIDYPFLNNAITDAKKWVSDIKSIVTDSGFVYSEGEQHKWEQATLIAMSEIFGN